jgi:aspartate carbamoyltransferase catalytic subunit
MVRNLSSIRSLEKEQIEELLAFALDFKERIKSGGSLPKIKKHTIGLLFPEGSARTRVSFEQAAHYLDFRVINFTENFSSNKGETLKDAVLTLRHELVEGLVMRHRSAGAPLLAAKYFGGPVVNAGDGCHEHPTQALADAVTILERKNTLKGLIVAIVGDVDNSRVARSNAWLLSKMGAEVRFVGPRTLMPGYTGKLPGAVYYDLSTGIEQADVIICLRLQKDRKADGMLMPLGEYNKFYQINRSNIRRAAKDCLVLHPGPVNRGLEVDDTIADSGHSAIAQQVENGIFVRMATLYWVFGGKPLPMGK